MNGQCIVYLKQMTIYLSERERALPPTCERSERTTSYLNCFKKEMITLSTLTG